MEPTIDEVIEWLEWGVPSDEVIRKESSGHLKNPSPVNYLALDLNVLVRFIYPKGGEKLEGVSEIYKDMVKRLIVFKSSGLH